MSFASFIASRITFKSKRTFSKLIVRIAIIGIMLGLGVMILSVAVVKGFKHEIREKIRGFDGDIRVVKFDLNTSFENSPFERDPGLEAKIKKRNFVTKIMPFATKPGIIKANDDIEGVILKGVDAGYDWSFIKANMVTGKVIDFTDTTEAKKQLLISQTTANRLKLQVGSKLLMYFVQEPLRRRSFTVVGIYDTSIEDIDKTYVVGDISIIKKLNDWGPNEIGGYELRVDDFERLDPTADYVNNLLPTRLRLSTVTENYPAIFEWLKILDVNAVIMLVLMLAVALINMISALLIMILERTAMIGILKAMGSSNWSIQKVFLYNAAYLVGLGLLLGNALGLGLSWFQYETHFFKLDPASYYMTFVPVLLDWTDILLLNAGTLVICLLVLIIPSMLVSKISPVRAIQFK